MDALCWCAVVAHSPARASAEGPKMPISRLIASCEELGVDPEALERLFAAAEEEVTSGKARSPPLLGIDPK